MKAQKLFIYCYALLVALLFTGVGWGLNVLLASAILWSIPFIRSIKNKSIIGIATGVVVAATICIAWYSHYSLTLWVSILSTFSYQFVFTDKPIFHFHHLPKILFIQPIAGVGAFIKDHEQIRVGKSTVSIKAVFRYTGVFFVILTFFLLYVTSSDSFATLSSAFFNRVIRGFEWVLEKIDFEFIAYLLLGVTLASTFLYKKFASDELMESLQEPQVLLRQRKPSYSRSTIGLKRENSRARLLLLGLNIMIALVLFGEIRDVWFGFSWSGGLLKSFVYEGTYRLVFSIILSMIVVLYYFRGNQNFYRGNKFLKALAYIWIACNALLTVSVIIRNYHYINHFGLAFGRIWLMTAMLAVFIGLLTIFLKVQKGKSFHYLLRVNSLTAVALVCIMSWINWPMVITKYNFDRSSQVLVHLNFMVELPDYTLPDLHRAPEELQEIMIYKNQKYSSSSFSRQLMEAEEYQEIIERRTRDFMNRMQSASWLEYNPAEQRAYENLKKSME